MKHICFRFKDKPDKIQSSKKNLVSTQETEIHFILWNDYFISNVQVLNITAFDSSNRKRQPKLFTICEVDKEIEAERLNHYMGHSNNQ